MHSIPATHRGRNQQHKHDRLIHMFGCNTLACWRMPQCWVPFSLQGSLLDNKELLESLNQAKAKAATINASLQESKLIQVTLVYKGSTLVIPTLECTSDLLQSQLKHVVAFGYTTPSNSQTARKS